MLGQRVLDMALALVVGGVMFTVLRPASAHDSNPARCFNQFGTEIACDLPAWPIGLSIAVVLTLSLWIMRGRRPEDNV